jgi:hypothetical protein
MTPAQSQTHLKRRLDDYIWREQALPMAKLRELLQTEFMPLGDVFVIGGLVRDIARFGKTRFKSDVDLVLAAPPKTVERFAARLNATPNRFGGFGVKTGNWKIDFWSLRNTWAHREGHVFIRNEKDLLKCTFFDIDSVVYNLNSRELVAEACYLDRIHDRSIDINLRPNPSEDGNLLRAVRRVLSWNLTPGPALREFFENSLSAPSFEMLQATESRLYPHYAYSRLYEHHEALLEALIMTRSRRLWRHGTSAQYHLPF